MKSDEIMPYLSFFWTKWLKLDYAKGNREKQLFLFICRIQIINAIITKYYDTNH